VVVPGSILKDTVWWKGLAQPSELNPEGTFRYVHVFGDPVTPGPPGAVGAYWGCQNTWSSRELLKAAVATAFASDAWPAAYMASLVRAHLGVNLAAGLIELDHQCDRYGDVRGAYYFRPSAVCNMRYPTHPFCRVCQHLIANAIYEAAGYPLVPPAL
jgi:hypothetical protein